MPFVPTPEQEAILGHDPNTHARVLAGPGTGKSATLVALVNQLLTGVPAPRVKLLTFTRAATAELAKKVSEHPAAAAERPSTIHSFAISILLRNPGTGGFPEPLRIADDWEDDNVVRPTLARRIGVRKDRLDNLFREMAANWESLRPDENPRVEAAERARFLGGWNEHREVYGYTLLAELPYALRNALNNHPDLDGVDYELLIVDEYQDLNACDLDVLRLIAARGCSIIGAGDDDQSIYSFRRAAPEGIRRFLDDYPEAGDYHLSVTQRCGSRIIEWATSVIEGDPGRPAGRPRLSSAEGSPPGEVALLAFAGETSEADGIARIVERLVNMEHIPASEILVLLRGDHNGTFSGPIKQHLAEFGVPFSDTGTVERILGEENNKKMIEILRLLVNRTDSLAWASLLKLADGIGDTFVDYVYEHARTNRLQFGRALLDLYAGNFPNGPAGSSGRARTLIEHILRWLETHHVPDATPDEGWGGWIIETAGDDTLPAPSAELATLLRSIDEIAETDQELGRYLGQINPLGKDITLAESPGVRIMTMGGSKGLTVQAAVIGALEDGIVPRPDGDLAEERRLLYVAMTRAKRFLYGTWARRRRGPTARAGRARVAARRLPSNFLEGGPVASQDGSDFIRRRWPLV